MNTEKITLSCAIDNWANSDVGLVVDLSEPIANSYIIAPGNTVYLPVVKRINQFWASGANGGVQDDKPSQAANGRGFDDAPEGIGNKTNWINNEAWVAEIIWTDIDISGGIISKITLTSGTGDVPLKVEVNGSMPHGNIVIGVKKTGVADYLWSWHLWITDFDPNVGTAILPSGIEVMDRDLGAINDTETDKGALGLVYQWGRKDPIVRLGDYGNAAMHNRYEGDGTAMSQDASVNKEINGSLLLSIQNPMMFYKQGGNRDWLVAGTPLGYNLKNRWGGNASHASSSGSGGEKTIYDPCPFGWRVPMVIGGGDGFSDVNTAGTLVRDIGRDLNYGYRYVGSGGITIYIPLGGVLSSGDSWESDSRAAWIMSHMYVHNIASKVTCYILRINCFGAVNYKGDWDSPGLGVSVRPMKS